MNNRGTVLMSNLLGRAKDVCRASRDKLLTSQDGAQLDFDAIYKRDPLSLVAHIFEEFRKLLFKRRSDSESFRNFELSFNAQLSKFNSFCEAVWLINAMAALQLLTNANADSSQRLSILAVAAPNGSMLNPRSSINEFVKLVK